MKKLFFLLLLSPMMLNAQTTVLKMGGAHFVDCKSVLAYGGQELVSFRLSDDGALLLSAQIFNEAGRLSATVTDNQSSSQGVVVSQGNNEILILDKYTGRKICQFQFQKSENGGQLEVAASFDYYLPSGKKLICSPDSSNQASLETLRGGTAQKSAVALSLE